jgi:CRISPR-associated protein Csy2
MPHDEETFHDAVLVLPRLRVQNANAISSPMTWGFPSITAFVGLMHALARRLPLNSGIEFRGVGIICHDFEEQADAGYTRAFRLTRNPVDKYGSTLAIVEEGRIHLDITLVFLVSLAEPHWPENERKNLADAIGKVVAEMRISGGSVFPPLTDGPRRAPRPRLQLLPDDEDKKRAYFRRMSRRWLPGFALVSRDDLLRAHAKALQETDPKATLLDAWLDLSRLNWRATRTSRVVDGTDEEIDTVEWIADPHKGWTVPIPVGYAAISELYAAGDVAGARDMTTPFRFVESVYSIGQWVSPHRLTDFNDLLWYSEHQEKGHLYSCRNDFVAPI